MQPEPEVIRPNYKGSEKLQDKVALDHGRRFRHRPLRGGPFRAGGLRRGHRVPGTGERGRPDRRRSSWSRKAGSACCIPGDIREQEFCSWAVKKTVQQFGKLNILVNNAAEQHPVAGFHRDRHGCHGKAPSAPISSPCSISAKAALPHLKAGDSIINTTTVTTYKGKPELIDYSSTKGAIAALHAVAVARTWRKRTSA